jgi:hypothetical protein
LSGKGRRKGSQARGLEAGETLECADSSGALVWLEPREFWEVQGREFWEVQGREFWEVQGRASEARERPVKVLLGAE